MHPTLHLEADPDAAGFGGGGTLQTLVERLAAEPLRFHPGTGWLYSWSTDVCAQLVEVLSGLRFDDFLSVTIFDPLGIDRHRVLGAGCRDRSVRGAVPP